MREREIAVSRAKRVSRWCSIMAKFKSCVQVRRTRR